MDKDRQIRFLYPPLIFISSLAFGIWLDGSDKVTKPITDILNSTTNVSIVVALLGLSSLVLLLGFFLGTITVFLLRICFIRNNHVYEIKLKKNSYKKIGQLVFKNKSNKILKKERLYAGVFFDHSIISEGVHLWIVRRWNSFFISCSSTVALISSLIIGLLLNIKVSCSWFFTVVIFISLFIIQAIFSWKETMGMIEFCLKTDNVEKEIAEEKNSPKEEQAQV